MRDLPVIEDPWIGRTLDERFQVLGLLGKGGMGAIYRCRPLDSGAEVAIKIILEQYATDPEVLARFEREIQANVGVAHPNVVRTLGHGRTPDGVPYFAMELLQGTLLEDVIDDEGPLGAERIAHMGAQIALGLHAAHQQGIVHRDLKPSNVIVGDHGTVKVFDFGLSLLRPPGEITGDGQPRLTEMDMRIGTPLYMAPEYIEGGELGPRADLYALGVVLYECCTGRTPFNGPAYQVLHKHATEAPRPIEDRVPGRHPAWLREVVEGLLAKDPEDRLPSGEAVAAALSRPPPLSGRVTTLSPQEAIDDAPASTLPEPPASAPADPAAPEPALPSGEGAPEPRPTRSGLGSLLLPLILVAAAIWHGFSVGLGIGSPDLPPGRSIATLWAASQVSAAGGDPYDPSALEKAARSAGHKGKVTRTFSPPAWLAATIWTGWMPVKVAWATWIGLQEVLLLACLALIWRAWRPLGLAPRLALLSATAAMGAVPLALDLGTPVFVLLFLLLAATQARGELESGLWLGLAGLVSLRAWLVLPLWAVRRQWTALLTAGLVFVGASLLTTPVVGVQALAGFWTGAVPDMLRGEFTGLGLRIDVFGNLAPSQVYAAILPGPSGQQLSGGALGLTWAVGLASLLALAWVHRRPAADPVQQAARSSAWLLGVILLPVYGHEALLPLALPAVALCLAGLWWGRLHRGLAIPLGIAVALLLYPVDPLRELYLTVFQPDLPWIAPLLRQIKLASLATVTACTVALSLSLPTEYAPHRDE